MNKSLLQLSILGICAATLTISCCTVVRTEADLFYRKHPEAKKTYARLDAVPIGFLAQGVMERRRSSSRKIEDLHTFAATNHIKLKRDKESALELARLTYEDNMKPIREIAAAAEESRGVVHMYETRQYEKDNSEFYLYKQGLVVILNGEIVKDVVMYEGKQWTNADATTEILPKTSGQNDK